MPGGLCHKRKASLCGKEYHWCTIGVPSFLADFEIIPIPNLPNLTGPRSHPPINLASNSLDRNDFKIRQKRRDPCSTPVPEYLMKIDVIWGKWELENDTAMTQPWMLIFVAISWFSQRDLYGAATLSLNPSIYLVNISEVRNYT